VTNIVSRLHTALANLVRRIINALSSENKPWRRLLARPAESGEAVRHIGATETFGTELRALRELEISPELVSDIETELHWGHLWYEFERTMQAEIDRVFARYLPEPECHDFGELRDQLGLREPIAA
jgi:hypothetical protein